MNKQLSELLGIELQKFKIKKMYGGELIEMVCSKEDLEFHVEYNQFEIISPCYIDFYAPENFLKLIKGGLRYDCELSNRFQYCGYIEKCCIPQLVRYINENKDNIKCKLMMNELLHTDWKQ